MKKQIQTALISVYYKEGLEPIVKRLHELGVRIISTGGTAKFISDLSIPVTEVETLTQFPEILGGRVKTLHPLIFGGILARQDNHNDQGDLARHKIPPIDLVIVGLYPFEEEVVNGSTHEKIIEKIDIGGVALIRAAAKNFNDVLVCPSTKHYLELQTLLDDYHGETSLEDRKYFATRAFVVTSTYENHISDYFCESK